jgi:signal transduction histidine kinase/CheY-like chemotaxis protein
MRSVLIFVLLVFSGLVSLASESIEALRKKLDTLAHPREIAIVYNELAWEYRDIRPDSALYYSNQALRISKNNNFHHLEVQSINYMGVAYRNLSVYSKAFEMYLEALRLSEEYDDQEQRGYTLINIGNLYLYQSNFQGAVNYFIQALDQAQTLGDRRMQAYCYINLGRSYEGMADYGQAQLYYRQAIEVRQMLDDNYGVLAAKIELAETHRKEGDFDEALGLIAEIMNKEEEASNPRIFIEIYNILSRIYIAKNDPDLAMDYATRALNISRAVSSRYDEINSLENLSKSFEVKSDHKQAYEYYVDYSELNQQLFSEENIRKIEQLKNQYESEKQEAENRFLKQQADLNQQIISRQQTIIVLSVLTIILLVIVAGSILRAYVIRKKLSDKIQQQRDRIETDKNTIETQSKKLMELDRAKSRFFANISHDLRSPLSLILGNLEILSEDPDSVLSKKANKSLEVSYKNSKRLLYLTDEINDIIKLEEGKISLKKESVRVNSYLNLLSEMFRSTAEYKGIKLELHSELSDQDTMLVDPRQFEKVFYNLLSNAIRHCTKGGLVSVKVHLESSRVIIAVQDTGEGISEESLPYIFDRFYQSKNEEYKSREGMGIGLALVKELVELHDGSIQVTSQKGKGTTFRVNVPVGSKNATGSVQMIHAVDEQHRIFRDLDVESRIKNNANNVKQDQPAILIVDDHPEIRHYIRTILEDQFTVYEASHGLEALDILRDLPIELIITDLMMPWMDGFELIEAINLNEKYRSIPLLVVSARINENDREKVMFKGINEFIQKPFSKKELTLRIENLLSQKEKYVSKKLSPFDQLVSGNLADVEKDLLMKLESVVQEKINDPSLSVFTLSDVMAASERQVYRLVKKLTGLTPHEYITETRMQFADHLIREGKVRNATEVARMVGMKNVTIFSNQFERKFGVRPNELINA